ncbi:MAG TPA: restriction endonuclease subunit S [Pyrinomonadaceae bacterium]|jgi:type I restriction enzyme S subunit
MFDEFKINSVGWCKVRFGDVVRNVDVTVRNPLEQGLERFVGLEHLEPESLQIKRWGNVADGTSFTRKFERGQILFGKRRAYQRKAAVADFGGICSGDILVFEPKTDELLPALLPFIVQSDGFFEHALGTSAGSLSPRTKWSDLARYEFSLPPKDEQQQIAEILWGADKTTLEYGKIIANLQILKQATIDEFIERNSDKWQFVEFSQITENGTLNGLYKPKTDYGDGIEVIHMGDLFANEIITNGGLQRIKLTDAEIKSHGLKTGDLIFARRSVVFEGAGQCSIIGNLNEPMSFESSLIRVSLNQEQAIPFFYFYWFQSESGKRVMSSITRRGSIAGIAASDLYRIKIPLPNVDEQKKLIEKVEAVKNSEKETKLAFEKAETLKVSLVSHLLTNK